MQIAGRHADVQLALPVRWFDFNLVDVARMRSRPRPASAPRPVLRREPGGLPELCLAWRLRLRIVRTALLPERRKTSIANAVVLQREYCDYITQGPPILLGPVAAKNAFVLRDRLHCRSFSIDA